MHGTFGAHVLAARLADEGFDVELRGPATVPTEGLTFGDMARVDVYVPDDQIDEASYVLLVDEVDEADDDPRRRSAAGSRDPPTRRRALGARRSRAGRCSAVASAHVARR